MKYIREYKATVPGGNVHVGVDGKYHWYVEIKGREWHPIQSSDKPVWIDNRKWEKIPEKLGINADQWNQLRRDIQAAEAEAESTEVDEEEFSDEIKAKANALLDSGDPIEYFLDVFNTMHVGDRELGKVMLCCIGTQHCTNSKGLHPKLSGESGMGKSDAIETFLHQLPKTAYIKTSMSSKAIFYHDIKPNTIIFLDDYKQNDELDSIIKQTSSKFHSPYEHRTIDKDRKAQVMTAPPGIVWAITSVDTSQDIQVLNRQVGLDVDSSEAMTRQVIDRLFEAAGTGEEPFPETDDVLVCRAMVAEIKANDYKVAVPYWDRVEWNDLSNRRNPSIFLDILKSITIWRHRQRERDGDYIIATEADFVEAKKLYVGRADTLIDKLTKAERRLVDVLVKWNGECYKDVAAREMGVTSQRVAQLVYGESGKTGLLQKLPGFEAELTTLKDESRNVSKLNLRFADWDKYQRLQAYQDIVRLKKQDAPPVRTPSCKSVKGSFPVETYTSTVSSRHSVSNVSKYSSIRENNSSGGREKDFSHISPKSGLHPYTVATDSETKTYTALTATPPTSDDADYGPFSTVIQTLSEMERTGDGYDVSAMSLEWDMDTDDCRRLLTDRGWTAPSRGGLWSPPSRT